MNPKSASFLENWSHVIVLAPEGTADPVRIHDMPNGTIIMAPRDRADWAPLSVPEEILIDFEIACLYSDEDVQHFKMRAAAGTLEELLAV